MEALRLFIVYKQESIQRGDVEQADQLAIIIQLLRQGNVSALLPRLRALTKNPTTPAKVIELSMLVIEAIVQVHPDQKEKTRES